jgi:hypothetical protein
MDKTYRIARVLLTMATATTIGACVAWLGCSLAAPMQPVAQAPASQINTATANPATTVSLQPATTTQPSPSWIR